MKKISILFLAVFALISFNSCTSDDDVVFVAQPDPEGIQFSNTFQNMYVVPTGNPDNLAERFVWNEVDFSAPTTITYELQASAKESFEDLMVIGTTDANNLGVTNGQMKELAADAGLDNDPESDLPNTGMVYFKVRAFAGEGEGNALEEFSDTVSLTVQLQEATDGGEPAKREFYLVGDATAAGWSNDNNNTPLFRDSENDNIYYFQGRFAGGENVEGFKLLEMLGAWQPQWGGSNGELTNSDILGEDPSALTVEKDAYYSLMINVDEMSYTWEEIDETEATVYETIGLVGEGTSVGWPNDDNQTPDLVMSQSEFNPHIWYLKDVVLSDGPIKFRANLAWDVSWGGNTFPSGEAAGDDIQATAGTYDVWFNSLDERYILIPKTQEN